MKLFLAILSGLISFAFFAQDPLSPSLFLGRELGQTFSRHLEIESYFIQLSKAAPSQIKLEYYGETPERRNLFYVIISSEENLKNLGEILSKHQQHTNEKVVLTWLSYNVHGNEPSGSEAAMQTAFDLITKRKELLNNQIVIIDPCLNPDGRDRYVNWFYSGEIKDNKSELIEPWISGRPNHYLFDLNRDWAWASQPETQQRIPHYNQWLPHIHGDFHEQGINEDYYFCPAAKPYHGKITEFQRSFQVGLGQHHSAHFDSLGWRHFSGEVYDLFYPSYGDTYPIFNGAIGLTYEQPGNGEAGSSVLTNNGDTLTLTERVAHHLLIGISTIEYASLHATELIEAQRNFYQLETQKHNYILEGNSRQLKELENLLALHEIQTAYVQEGSYSVNDYFTSKKINHTFQEALQVSNQQKKGKLIDVLFEAVTSLEDSLTYDITAWNLPLAYGLKCYTSSSILPSKKPKGKLLPYAIDSAVGLAVIKWNFISDAVLLQELLANNMLVRHAEKYMRLNDIEIKPGDLFLLAEDQKNDNFYAVLNAGLNQHQPELICVEKEKLNTKIVHKIKELDTIIVPKIAVLNDQATNTLNVGEIWYYLEKELRVPFNKIHLKDFEQDNILSKYTTIIIPETEDTLPLHRLQKWVENGGNLILISKATDNWNLNSITTQQLPEIPIDTSLNEERAALSYIINGAIFPCQLDKNSALNYGIENYYALRQNSSIKMDSKTKSSATISASSPLNGFVGAHLRGYQLNSVAYGMEPYGKGQVIYFIDNPLFRAFWKNGSFVFGNAIYHSAR